MKPIRKAVFPVAGLGTRFLPATKAIPKEMLTVVDRPLIQHVVDEAREAGIEHFIFVTGRGKSPIEDHFDRQFELETTLRERRKTAELTLLEQDLPAAGATSFTRQQSPLGLGHAVWCARELVGREPFALLLPDVLVQGKPSCLAQMIGAYKELNEAANIIAVEEVPQDQVSSYGVVGVGERKGRSRRITSMVEKPKPAEAPSNLIITGRYILQPEIFDLLADQQSGAGGEIQLTDALLLPDMLIQHKPGCLKQMIEAYRGLDDKSNVIAVEEVPPERIHMYGVVGVGKTKGKSFAITEMVEKPPREQAPSNLIITGRYILQPEIFGLLATQEGGAGGEIQLTDAMIKLAKKQPFFGLKFKGRSFDCGSKVGFLAANVAYALARSDIAPALRAEIKRLL